MQLDPKDLSMNNQLTQDDLRRMTPEQIVAAQDAGQCDDLLGISRFPAHGQLTRAHLSQMKTHEIRQAYREGRLTELLDTTD